MLNQNHYQNLGLNRDAKPDAITAAHIALTEKCRAELSPNADGSRYLTAIDTALAVLSDPQQRAAYDLQLQNGEIPETLLVKEPAHRKPSVTTGTKKQKHTAPSIANAVAKIATEAPIVAETPQKKLLPLSVGMVLVAAAGIAWFTSSKFSTDSSALPTASSESTLPASAEIIAKTETISPLNTPNTESKPVSNDAGVSELSELSYDAATIDQFVGSWQAQGESGALKTLELSLKTPESLVFKIKTKSGKNIGDIVGVAEFENGSARFLNAEYGCKLVFTRSAENLNVTTGDCKAFHQNGAEFDGSYVKPRAPKPTPTKIAVKNNETKNSEAAISQNPPPVAALEETPTAANPGKLFRYVATVKDAEGKTQRIELVAANEDAARAILRDFRGNPKVIRIRKAWF